MTQATWKRRAVAAAILAALAGGAAFSQVEMKKNAAVVDKPVPGVTYASPAAADAPKPVIATQAGPVAGVAPVTDFSSIVERYGNAVVNISVTGKPSKRDQQAAVPDLDPNDPFSQFFRHFGPQLQMPSAPQLVRGQGSGFILTADGVVLTNAHVVENADEVTVKLTDRREFKAKVVGVDKQSDIAVLRISATNLPTVVVGNPALVKVGEPVLAIGSPYGFENSATAGIVSAKSRSLPDESYIPFIQSDAAINPGNSGGPLFNIRGEVIGINSQIYSQTGGYQGLAFSIPIDVAMRVEQQLSTHGKVVRGKLGITVQEVNQALAQSFGLPRAEGALVSSVEKGSAAAKAGVLTGDVIIGFNDQTIDRSSDLPNIVGDLPPGTKATLTVIRNGAQKRISVVTGEAALKVADSQETPGANDRLGLSVRALTPQEQQANEVDSGLVASQVTGAAAVAGIQEGDIILSINGTPVTSVAQLRQLVSKAGKNVALLIERDGDKIFVPLTLG